MELYVLLGFCLVLICIFEFINGFHDTANAVAPVIYTKSLGAKKAVLIAAFFNFLGVSLGGIGVAMGIVHLLPLELMAHEGIGLSLCVIISLLFSAIIWNFGTWYLGMPASSSHTLIGSILGVSLAMGYITQYDVVMPWAKVGNTFEGLLISPIIGFVLAFGVMHILHLAMKKKSFFRNPEENKKKSPKPWTKYLLIASSAFVSFAHGSNDGQKGVGLAMLIVISLLPLSFAINPGVNAILIEKSATHLKESIINTDHTNIDIITRGAIETIENESIKISSLIKTGDIHGDQAIELRESILKIQNESKKIEQSNEYIASVMIEDVRNLSTAIDYVPWWIIAMISVSLGLGTLVGWKRIVVTIGEKIGTSHMTYAQGVAASLVTAVTISSASRLHLPVSTTHILSSGIAGTMAHEYGKNGLQGDTIKSILLAWILTLPSSTLLAGLLFLILHFIFLR